MKTSTFIKTTIGITAAICLAIPTVFITTYSANTHNLPDSNNYALSSNIAIDVEDADQKDSEGNLKKGTIDSRDFYKLADGLDTITAARKQFIGDLNSLATPSKSNLVAAVNDCFELSK